MKALKRIAILVSVALFGAYSTVAGAGNAPVAAKGAAKKEVAIVQHKVDLAMAANVLNDVEAGEENVAVASTNVVNDIKDIEEAESTLQAVAQQEKDLSLLGIEKDAGLPAAPYVDSTTAVAKQDQEFENFNFDEFERMLKEDFALLGEEGEE